MAKPKILVTGATGGTGAPVVAELLAKGFPVRAVVHKRDARSDAFDRQGVETVIADLYDPDQLRDAMKGVQRAYFLPLIEPFDDAQWRAEHAAQMRGTAADPTDGRVSAASARPRITAPDDLDANHPPLRFAE